MGLLGASGLMVRLRHRHRVASRATVGLLFRVSIGDGIPMALIQEVRAKLVQGLGLETRGTMARARVRVRALVGGAGYRIGLRIGLRSPNLGWG